MAEKQITKLRCTNFTKCRGMKADNAEQMKGIKNED